MKSKTLCCKGSLLKHDITRFFPIWVLYSLLLCLIVVFPMNTIHNTYLRANLLGDEIIIIMVVNFAYALLNALILFGDLFKTRMCYALHAMPVKRDDFYWAHMGAGILFSVIPNLLATFVMMAMLPQYALYVWGWFAAALGSYLFFFALAVLCVMLSGNYLGAILIYGIVNFFAVLVSWYVTQVCGSFLYGVNISDDLIMNFCPIWKMARHSYIDVKCFEGVYPNYEISSISFTSGYRPLGIYTAVGVVLMAASQVAYRCRKLESAGDLVAIPKLKPVFLVLFTLTAGAFSHLFGQLITGSTALPMLIVGIVVGYVAGQMLLQKQLNVWKPKNFVPLAAILAVLALAMGVSALDPMGLVTYIPEAGDIEGVRVENETIDRRNYDDYYRKEPLFCLDGERIADALTLHETGLQGRKLQHHGSWVNSMTGAYGHEDYENNVPISIIYRLKSGREVRRYYSIPVDTESKEELKRLLSAPERVLGVHTPAELPDLAQKLWKITVESSYDRHGSVYSIDEPERVLSLLEALYADCKEGSLASYYSLRVEDDYMGWMYLEPKQGATFDYARGFYGGFNLYSGSKNVMNWLEANGIHLPTQAEAEEGYAYG